MTVNLAPEDRHPKTAMLCKGFSTTRIDGDKILETLYALLPDGTALISGEHVRTNHFDGNGRHWIACEHGAEWIKRHTGFIGHYLTPSTRLSGEQR